MNTLYTTNLRFVKLENFKNSIDQKLLILIKCLGALARRPCEKGEKAMVKFISAVFVAVELLANLVTIVDFLRRNTKEIKCEMVSKPWLNVVI